MSPEPDPLENGGAIVRYTAKELFDRIDKKLDAVLISLDLKAEERDLAELRARVKTLEDESVSASAVRAWKVRFVGLSISVGGLGAAVAGLVIARVTG